MQSLSDIFISGLVRKSQDIPERVMHQARKALLDYLGVLAGGKKYLQQKHPELIESAPSASFLNGFAAHVLELDDGHRLGMIHPGASVVSAVLGVSGEQNLASGDVLRGIVMGYEAAVRLARAVQPGHKERGYHVSGTCGTIGSALGVAFACNYSEKQIKSTLACAVSSAAGVLEIQEQASELKPYNLGRAAMAAVQAAQLGKLALPGPDDILGGKRGFLSAVTDTPHPEFLEDFLDESYAIEGIYQKVHAACRHCHPAIDAVLSIRRDTALNPGQIEKIEVRTYRLAVGSHDHTDIRGIASAKLSTPFAVALAVVKGSAGYADYTDATLADNSIRELTLKVSVIEDEEFTGLSPKIRGAGVTFFLRNGEQFQASCLYPKGEPENPLSDEELQAKFRGLAAYGGLPAADCDKIIDEVLNTDCFISLEKLFCR